MKQKIALFIACLLITFVLVGALYLFGFIKTSQEFFSYMLVFTVGSFLFELYIRPVINKMFK
ncbi:MAG: hypothetical protein WCY89_10585 [Flavobacteriaceae bacterium]